jgi:WD40 repeat protein
MIPDAHDEAISRMISLDDHTLVTGSYDKSIKFWDINAGICTHTIADAHSDVVARLAKLKDGRIVSGGGSADKKLKLWALCSDDEPQGAYCCQAMLLGHKAAVSAILQLEDGRIVSGGRDDVIILWEVPPPPEGDAVDGNAASGEHSPRPSKIQSLLPTRLLRGHTSGITCLIQTSEGLLISGSGDHSLGVWDVNRRSANMLVKTIPSPTDSAIYSLGLLADGVTVCVGTHCGKIQILNPNSVSNVSSSARVNNNWVKEFKAHNDYVSSLTISANGSQLLSCGGDNVIRVWGL